ncbi:MAG: hypothetical protein IPM54_12350 [Polyangiaceae bacterium]|nr:hypothetical protein [Polyangiaceae bacterium]
MRQPGVSNKVGQWANFWGDKDKKTLFPREQESAFAQEAANADIIFVFDASAPPESVYYFGKNTRLRCPKKPAPKPYDRVAGTGNLAEVTAAREAAQGDSKQGNGQTTSTGTGNGQTTSTTAANPASPKKGDGQTTSTSGPDGNGPPLNFLQVLSRNLAIAGALASGDTSGSLKDPNGSRYGIPSGKNAGGPDLLLLQAAAGTFAVIGIPFKSGKEFIDTVTRALSQKKVAGILDPKVLSREIAEQLAHEPEQAVIDKAIAALKQGNTKPFEALESFGKAMAPSLRDAAVILPYSRAKIFTRGWEGKFQAHHILEVDMGDKVFKLGKAIDDVPAIVLSEAEHKAVTKALEEARATVLAGTGKKYPDQQQLWAIYQKVYAPYPSWLKAIESYFP